MMTVPGFLLLLVVYMLVNGAVFLYFARDKIKAKKIAWRIPENRLGVFCISWPVWSLVWYACIPA